MKQTNIPFCKSIPDSWTIIPNKYLFFSSSKKVGKNWQNYNLLSLTTAGVKEKDINAGGGKVPDNFENYQTVEPGDLIFCLFDLDVSAVFSGLSKLSGMITSAYDVLRPNSDLIDQDYIDYWFRYVFSNRYYKIYSKNIRYTIGSDAFSSINTPIPPLCEQVRIGKYLNEKIHLMNEIIELETKQIDLLEKYKTQLIYETVCKGLHPDVKHKDSGSKWLGSIPSHYKCIKLKYLLLRNDGGVWGDDPLNDNYDKLVLRSTEQTIDGQWNISDPATRNLKSINKLESYVIKCGDLLVTKSSGSKLHIGKTTLAGPEFENKEYYYSNFLQRLRTNNELLPAFLWYILNCPCSRNQFVYMTNSTSGLGNINADDLNNLFIPCPPIDEQLEIVKFLDKKNSKINLLIKIKKDKIQKLEDYKKTTVYLLVTGKKRVTI